jgi:hypothetical protein
MYKFSLIFFIILISLTDTIAQPNLKIEPRNVKFESIFDRYDYSMLINEGNQILTIDSLSFIKPYYLIDFANAQQLPVSINPGDTVKMNIVLTNFYNITLNDTTDTIWVYSNDPESPRDIRIKIDFFDDDFGNCSGTILDETLNPVPNSKIYFFYYGIYLFDSTYTDGAGIYNKLLPTGIYTVASEKDGYRVMFSGNTPDPFFAQPVQLDSGQIINVDLIIPLLKNTGLTVSGVMIDSIYGTSIDKGVVIVRKGTHTPTLLKKQNMLAADSTVYSGFVRPDGTYDIVVEDSAYYFVQGYSNYYLPTYYNNQNSTSVFWQNADSIFVDQSISSKNLYLERDSSYGGGGAYGTIMLPFIDATGYDGITVFAKSIINNQLYTYNFGKEDGRFYINNLPYGTYQLIAQKIGFENAISNSFTISPQNENQYNLNIQFTLTDVKSEIFIPSQIKLNQNYPNPFNPNTFISFYLPVTDNVTLKVFNTLGKEVATLVNEEKPAGNHVVEFGNSFRINQLASGIYFYQLQAGSFVYTKKMILMK